MTIYTVPNNLLGKVDRVNFIDYINKFPAEKNKVLFSQNVISFVIDGEKEIYFPDMTVKIKNSVALIRASNCLMSERKTNENKPYRALLIFFDNSFLAEFKIKYQNKFNKKNDELSTRVNIIRNDAFLLMYRKFILDTLSLEGNILTQKIKELKLEELLVYLLNHYPKELQSFLKHKADDNNIQFKSIIEQNRLKNLSIDELAFLSNMSISTFKRYFKKYYNSSPQKWFLNERMNYAKFLIEQGKRPTEIFREIGYSSLSNFIKAYKKHFQTAPNKN